jgi:hypothetical protein
MFHKAALSAALTLAATAAGATDSWSVSSFSAAYAEDGQSARFTIDWVWEPDFTWTDEFGRPQLEFAFWVDPDAGPAWTRSLQHLSGALPDSKQTVLMSRPMGTTGQVEAAWVAANPAPGAESVGGWGTRMAMLPVSIDRTRLTFDVSTALLQDTDGKFFYTFEVYHFGENELSSLQGESGEVYTLNVVSGVPEPATWGLLLAGLPLLLGARRRAKRPAA